MRCRVPACGWRGWIPVADRVQGFLPCRPSPSASPCSRRCRPPDTGAGWCGRASASVPRNGRRGGSDWRAVRFRAGARGRRGQSCLKRLQGRVPGFSCRQLRRRASRRAAPPRRLCGPPRFLHLLRAGLPALVLKDQGGKARPGQVKGVQEARKVLRRRGPMARTTPKMRTRKPGTRPGSRFGNSARPSAAHSKPNCGPIRAAAPISWNAGGSSTTPACAVIGRRHRRLQGDALGDGRHAKSLERDPHGIHPRQPQAELGIAFELGRRLGQELAFTHGIDIGRGRGIGI